MKNIKYVPLVLLCLFCIKFLIKEIHLPDMCVITALACLTYYFQRVEKTEELEKLNKRLDAMDKVLTDTSKLNDDLKQSMSAMKVAQGFKPQQNGRTF